MSHKNSDLPQNENPKQRAKELRRAGNLSEALLWTRIKNGQINGLDFDRQKVIGNYIVDFYCAEKKIVIEIDGQSHDYKIDYDKKRDEFLEGLGLTVIHLLDCDVRKRIHDMAEYLISHPAIK